LQSEASQGQRHKTSPEKQSKEWLAQVVEYHPSKHEALSSNFSTSLIHKTRTTNKQTNKQTKKAKK
jgi:hypothetical protein